MANKAELRKNWAKDARRAFLGRRIVDARYMTDQEMSDHGWDESPLVLFLDDGTAVYASSDDEGNSAGALYTTNRQFEIAPVI